MYFCGLDFWSFPTCSPGMAVKNAYNTNNEQQQLITNKQKKKSLTAEHTTAGW